MRQTTGSLVKALSFQLRGRTSTTCTGTGAGADADAGDGDGDGDGGDSSNSTVRGSGRTVNAFPPPSLNLPYLAEDWQTVDLAACRAVQVCEGNS